MQGWKGQQGSGYVNATQAFKVKSRHSPQLHTPTSTLAQSPHQLPRRLDLQPPPTYPPAQLAHRFNLQLRLCNLASLLPFPLNYLHARSTSSPSSMPGQPPSSDAHRRHLQPPGKSPVLATSRPTPTPFSTSSLSSPPRRDTLGIDPTIVVKLLNLNVVAIPRFPSMFLAGLAILL
jgi:hypothetical protein